MSVVIVRSVRSLMRTTQMWQRKMSSSMGTWTGLSMICVCMRGFINIMSRQQLFMSALNSEMMFIVPSIPSTSWPNGDAVTSLNRMETLSMDVSERVVSRRAALKCFLTYCRSSLFSLSPQVNIERQCGRLKVISWSSGDAPSARSNGWTRETGG